MLWKNCIRAAAAARKTRGKKKKYRRNAFVSKLNTHVCVAVCVRVEKKAKVVGSMRWFSVFVLLLLLPLFHCSSPPYNHFSPFRATAKKGPQRTARRTEKGVQRRPEKKRKCKSKSIYYAAMAWRGLQEACTTSESTNCSAHKSHIYMRAHTHTTKMKPF